MYLFNLPQTVRHSAARHPDKTAFRFMSASLTYAELEKRMNQLANQLIDLGVKKGDRVGIFMARSLETAVAMYGIMAAGAVYVPINPSQPAERTQFLIKDCGIKTLITNAGQRRALPAIVTKDLGLKIVIGSPVELPIPTISWERVGKQSVENSAVNILETDPAYILYTSGSTGTPKGILHTHRSGLAYAKLSVETYELTSDDVIGNHAPIYFDISTLGFFASPLAGATTIIASEAHIKMPASLSQLIEKEKVTVWYSVPLALIQMLQRGGLSERKMDALRLVIFAGELFPTKHLRATMEVLQGVKFCNAYGPTETNVCTNFFLTEKPESNEPISIGSPWGNTEILILEEDSEQMFTKLSKFCKHEQSGKTGELLVRSATLMSGYWGREDLNQKSFLRIKNEAGTESIFYRTGDLVRLELDGKLTFFGRKDRQVKTRGFRVELDEITNAILQHEAVKEAAVFTVSDEEEQILIEAAVVLKSPNLSEEGSILSFLKTKLPWYALPRKIILTDDFPRTATGKIDLKNIRTQNVSAG